MKFSMNGIDVRVPKAKIEAIVRQQILGVTSETVTPKLGYEWPGQGGRYAGIVRGADAEPDYHLIVLDVISMADQKWQEAMDWATNCEHEGHKDYTLPNRRDQSVMYANVKELFDEARYWSCEQYAGNPVCAWYANFVNGGQNYYLKGNGARARAVRRLPI